MQIKVRVLLGICLSKIGPSAALLWFPNSLYFLSYCHFLDPSYTINIKPYILLACLLVAGPVFFYAIEINRHLGTTTVARLCAVATLLAYLGAYFTSSPGLFLFLVAVLPLVVLALITIPLLTVLYKYF